MYANQSVAYVLLKEAFDGLDVDAFVWLDDVLHSARWVENTQSENLRKLHMDIGAKLGWEGKIPRSEVPTSGYWPRTRHIGVSTYQGITPQTAYPQRF